MKTNQHETASFNGYTDALVRSCILTKEGTIEIIYQNPSNSMFLTYPSSPAPDHVWKEIYGVVDGKIQLIKTIPGKHEPAYQVREKIIFEDKEE